MWREATILAVVLVYAAACRRGWLRGRPLAFAALWSIMLLLETLWGRTQLATRAVIAEPFHALRLVWIQQWVSHSQWTFYGLAGNVLIFVPLGMVLSEKPGAWRKYLAPLLVSLAIECAQWWTRLGTFEVDDVICNMVGGALGYWLGRRLAGEDGGSLLFPIAYLAALAVCCARSIACG